MKIVLFLISLFLGINSLFAQYEIRHQITFGHNLTDLYARKFDPKDGIAMNNEKLAFALAYPDKEAPKYQTQRLDFNTQSYHGFFAGYIMTLDFNRRYSIDFGAMISHRGYKTKLDTSLYNFKDFHELYGINPAFGSAKDGSLHRYHEDFNHWMLEIPVYFKKNINSVFSAYLGTNIGIQLLSTDRRKPLTVYDIASDNNTDVLYLRYTDIDIDISAVAGLELLVSKSIAFFAQGEYSLLSLDGARETGVHFIGLKSGVKITFDRM
jgi:hypothetical protein